MGKSTTIMIQKRILGKFKQLCIQMSIPYTNYLSELILNFLEKPFEIEHIELKRVDYRLRIREELLVLLKKHAIKHDLHIYLIIENIIDKELLNYAILEPKLLMNLIHLIREIKEKDYLFKKSSTPYCYETDDYYNKLLDLETLLRNKYNVKSLLLDKILDKFDRYYEEHFSTWNKR